MENASFALKRFLGYGIDSQQRITKRPIFLLAYFIVSSFWFVHQPFAQETKYPNVSGSFYPDNPRELNRMLDKLIAQPIPGENSTDIFALIIPHAGYGYSGLTAGLGYQAIKGRGYKTVVIIGPSHYYSFIGASIYPKGKFQTPLGTLEVDEEFAKKLLYQDKDIYFDPEAFKKEHSVEVQLPFLQKSLSGFKIVPIITGDCSLSTCQRLADLLKGAIAKRKDVLVIASTDMYHGYDFQESEIIDELTLAYLKNMDGEGLYYGLREQKLQLCGGFGVVTTVILSKELGYSTLSILSYTNSAIVTQKKAKGSWTVGYTACLIGTRQIQDTNAEHKQTGKGEKEMLNPVQRKRLLEIARNSIKTYLATGNKLKLSEDDAGLLKQMGAFVTLNRHGQLRGCIGSLIGRQPLYLTVRDMAIESAVGDPRFPKLEEAELDEVEIEISVLSPMEKVDNPEKIKLGTHGVLVKRGFNSGVFLPQVATETGWSKEEFLSNLCSHKAGLNPDAWKESSTELYIFTAEVFSEKED
jgi:AmmeMemoRadiSam system protein B/AmmeMemoRadiSam system protein A